MNLISDKKARDLIEALKDIGNGAAMLDLQKRLGATAVAEAEKGVRQSRDPYGQAWAPLTSRTGRPLRDTGNNIQRSWNARPRGTRSFVFGSRFKWLKTHQYGAVIVPKRASRLRFKVATSYSIRGRRATFGTVYAKRVVIPRRQLVPEQNTGGLGPIWQKAFDRAAGRWLRDTTRSR